MDSSEENHVFNSLLNQSFDFIDSDSIGAAIVLLDSAKNINKTELKEYLDSLNNLLETYSKRHIKTIKI